jgi:hypothetical protein
MKFQLFREELGWYDITTSEAALGFKIHNRTHNFVDERNFRYQKSKIA